jgi:hypothetical protein
MREFDINNPWTTDEIETERKIKKRNTYIFNIILVVLLSLFFKFNINDFIFFIFFIFCFLVVSNGLRILYVLIYFETLNKNGYNELSKLKMKNSAVKDYLNKVKDNEREILLKEYDKLHEQYFIEQKNKAKNEMFKI